MAETERRRSGRPRKAVSREQSVNMRRERNRGAQRSFRLRQQMSEKERKQQSHQLENAIDQIVSIFLACTDHVMNSEWARRDSDLINKLRQSIQTMHSLLPETRGLDVNLAQRDGHRNSTIPATVRTRPKDGNESSPEDTAERDVNIRRHSVSMPEETMHASLENGRKSKPVTTSPRKVDGNVGFGSYLKANVIDSQRMSQTSWLGNELAPMVGNPESLDSPFSLQVTISTLKHGYDVLLSTMNATEPSIIRTFGIAMQRLLKPGGHLMLSEVTIKRIFSGFIMGSLPGRWLGKDDGRSGGRLQDADEWSAALTKAGSVSWQKLAHSIQKQFELLSGHN
ncbi:polyketide synthase [Fusarium phyllophilum]|uniref:Polyketide synthase n=1 Tax=Fusarium phyllophilum TaxID=47803 RepID=A0A8H5K618_9HYPO|nr:polyketide synthase [Fusarium phyllophilum]